ncbi:MAG: hypothetical protein U1F45_19650 [Burkholderiales bacterium]
MKGIPINDPGALRNELAKYKRGKKLDIRQFNQAARLAWLGRAVLSPLDPEDPDCKAWLLYLQRPEGLAEHCLVVDEDLLQFIHVLDAEQGAHLVAILGEGVKARAGELEALNRRDFYLDRYFDPEKGKG